MQWNSWIDFFEMGGYAYYVWFSFGMTFVCIFWELLSLKIRFRSAKQYIEDIAGE